MLHVAAFGRAERAKCQQQQECAGDEDRQTDDRDDYRQALELRVHSPVTLVMKASSRNLPENIDAVIFDFDETMIDLENQHTAAHARLCRSLGSSYDEMPEEFRRGSGRRIIDDVRDMRDFFGWTRPVGELFEERQRYFDEEIAAGHDLELMRGVEETVRRLHERGFILAVTTSAVRSSIETILRRFDLLDAFAVIVDGGEVRRGKPDPEAYLLTAKKVRADPAHCVVFEDSTVGVRAAKSAGMFCIAVRNPKAQFRQDLEPADIVVESFDAVDDRWFRSCLRQ